MTKQRRSTLFLAAFLGAATVFAPLLCHAGTVQLTREEDQALASANSLSKAFTAVAKIIRPAVVNIKVERRVTTMGNFNDPMEMFRNIFEQRGPVSPRPRTHTETGQGSGVIVDGEGYILTNNHVVGSADAISVFLLDGRVFQAELIGADPNTDVAVIKIEADNLSVATVGDSDIMEVGEMVLAVGNPFGLDFTVTSGIISAKGRSGMDILDIEDFIQTDASINPGNSGGPLVNLKGEVIGINTVIYTAKNANTNIGVSFAIPSNMAKNIMQSLITHKQVTSSYLGVESQALTPDIAQAFGLPSPKGALVEAVHKNSPAEKAGFRRGDIVLKWGKREISDNLSFRNLVIVTTPGQPVDVEVFRDGRTVLLQVVLDSKTPEFVMEGRSDRFLQNLGITVEDLTPELRRELGIAPNTEGVLVYEVERNSIAHQIGLLPGSIIMSINGKDVQNQQDLRAIIGASDRIGSYDLIWQYRRAWRRMVLKGR